VATLLQMTAPMCLLCWLTGRPIADPSTRHTDSRQDRGRSRRTNLHAAERNDSSATPHFPSSVSANRSHSTAHIHPSVQCSRHTAAVAVVTVSNLSLSVCLPVCRSPSLSVCARTKCNNTGSIMSVIRLALKLLQQFYGSLDFVWNTLGEPVPEETFTPIVVIKYPYLPPPSTTIHGILPIQSTCFTVLFHNLSPSFLWSTSWPGTLHFILHTFLDPIIIVFSQHMPLPSQPVLL